MTNSQYHSIFDYPLIDEEQFADMRELLEDDFVNLIQTYILDSEQRIEVMRTAQAENDNASGFDAAHALKGASATLGTTQLVVLSDQLQESCRTQNIGEQTELIDQMVVALHNVEREISLRLGL